MTILRDLSVIWSLLHVLVLFVFLYEPRFPKKKSMLLTSAAMVPWTAVNAVLYVLLGPEKMAQVLLLTATLPSLIFFYFMAKHRDGRFFFTFCFADTVAYGVIVLTSVMDYYLFGSRYIFMLASRLVAFPVMEFAAWKYLRGFYHDLQRTVRRGWGVFAVVSALFYVLLVLMSSYPVIFYENPGQTPALILVTVLMVLMYVNIFQVLHNQQKVFYAMEEERRVNQQAQLLRTELEVERQYVESARRHRHDLHHHEKVVYECLERGEVEDAKQYLKRYREQLEETALQTYCSEPVVNALLRMTERRCTSNGIAFQMKGDIPKGISLSEPECSTVFGNLLENACEACEQCRNAKLCIYAEPRQGALYVEIRNSVSGKVAFDGDRPVSTKAGGGIGLRSASGVLAKYDGMMTFHQEGHAFITRVILPL